MSSFGFGQEHKAATRFAAVDSVIEQAIANEELPGAVLLIGHQGHIVYRKSYGARSLKPTHEAMTTNTIFDLASLTKPFTATSVMQLVEVGKVRLDDPVRHYLPEFSGGGKDQITVRQLLTHFSGLREDLDLREPWQGRDEAYRRAFHEPVDTPPGSDFRYSDIDYIVLGALIERVSGVRLDDYMQQHIFSPLHLTDTGFNPDKQQLLRIAPTEYDEKHVMLRGVVHDPTARRMGGIAGHAGLFASADDLAVFAQEMLSAHRLLSRASVEKMTTPQQPVESPVLRGLGWDIDSPYSSNRGDYFPVGSYGHTGFTGTSLWIDPTSQTYIILLANAVHPQGRNNGMVSLRARVANAVYTALLEEYGTNDAAPETQRLGSMSGATSAVASRHFRLRNADVLTGIDVLEKHGFRELLPAAGKDAERSCRVGILTNASGMDRDGRRTIDILTQYDRCRLAAIFSPEHGLSSDIDSASIADSSDPVTQAPIYSVYGVGDEMKRPPIDVIRKLDVIVIDLPDVGARFYTYATTVKYFLEAAAATGKKVLLLDRPNPITGSIVQGPMSLAGEGAAFTNVYPLPVRHGMTMGELARLFNSEMKIGAALEVVPMEGWMREDWFDATGLRWTNPSPNIRNLTQATLYPGIALIEGTNISVGRGTDTPFEVVGAPWVDARVLARYLNRRVISGVRFLPVQFVPTSGPFAKQDCRGVNILVSDRYRFDAPELGLELAAALHELYPKEFQIEKMQSLLANREVLNKLLAGEDPRRIRDEGREGLEWFYQIRQRYLIYPPESATNGVMQ